MQARKLFEEELMKTSMLLKAYALVCDLKDETKK